MTFMRRGTATFVLSLGVSTSAQADGFILGSGSWTCGQALATVQNGTPLDRGQLIGWIMGFWTAASFEQEDGLAQVLAQSGGQTVANLTINECRQQPANAPIYLVTQGLIENTRASIAAAAETSEGE